MGESVNVVDRIFLILEYLSLEHEPKGPTDIASAIGLNKSTVYRLLSAMCERGYTEKEDNGTYRIGVKLVEISSNHINNLELHTEARPSLNALHDELGLAVYLGKLDHDEVVYLDKMDISRSLRIYNQIGMRVPAHCSSLGKCMLANISGDDLNFILHGVELDRYTENTITSKSALKEHLREVRRQGWAMDNEEYIIGHRCIGAPIFDYRGEVIAAVSASGPKTLVEENRFEAIIEKVTQTAAEISRRLCYRDYSSERP